MAEETMSTNFIHSIIEEELEPGGRCAGKQVHTRFPPGPTATSISGHCKALTIDFGTAEKYHGICNLRMDDTNPAKEDTEYVDAIQEDIHWLGYDWGDRFYYGSDYFEQTYELAEDLIQRDWPMFVNLRRSSSGLIEGIPLPRHRALGGTVRWKRAWNCFDG